LLINKCPFFSLRPSTSVVPAYSALSVSVAPSFFNKINIQIFIGVWVSFWAVGKLLISKSSLFKSVLHIVFLRSNKKVSRIYAKPVVALVANKQIAWDLKRCQLPRHSMGFHVFAGHRENSIPTNVFLPSPLPAARRALLDLSPKSFLKVGHSWAS
jgi:hypothetical protein